MLGEDRRSEMARSARLVKDDVGCFLEQRVVVLGALQQPACRAEQQARAAVAHALAADGEAHRLADRLLQEVGDALREGDGREAPRLRDDDLGIGELSARREEKSAPRTTQAT